MGAGTAAPGGYTNGGRGPTAEGRNLIEKRPFGKTGVELPILSLGCQRLVNEEGRSQDQAVAILEQPLKRGVWYFDTTPAYSEGESERRVGLVAIRRRMDMWIATKVNETTRDGARRQLEASLDRLQTDHVEEVRLHNVFSFDRLDAMTGNGEALQALIEAGMRAWSGSSASQDMQIPRCFSRASGDFLSTQPCAPCRRWIISSTASQRSLCPLRSRNTWASSA
jgi:aryl-alcohol dehydrogenase-like predicted oxidoreductase